MKRARPSPGAPAMRYIPAAFVPGKSDTPQAVRSVAFHHPRKLSGRNVDMLRLLCSAFWAFMRLLLSLRYRMRVHGKQQLRGLKGPVVVFPNHPAYIDPGLVLAQLWPDLHLKPVLYEGL